MFFVKFIVFFPLLPIAIVVIALTPIFKLRFGEIPSDRIGHFGCIIELYLCEKDKLKKKFTTFDFFCFSKNICNYQIKRFWERKLNILPMRFVSGIIFWLNILPYGNKNNIFSLGNELENFNFFMHKDIKNILDKSKKHYEFSKKEINFSRKLAEKKKINLKKKTVILYVRDNKYFAKYHKNIDQNRLSSKNVNLKTYEKSIKFLINKGYQVIRVGKYSNQKIKLKSNLYFDLTNEKDTFEILQLYLISISKFIIGSNSGIMYLSSFVFRKPCYITNHIPHGFFYIESRNLMINFKKIFSLKKKKILNLSEIYHNNLFFDERSQEIKKNYCKIIDQNSNEIEANLKLFLRKVENNFLKNKMEINLEKKFLDNFNNILKKNYFRKNTYGLFKGCFGIQYLKKNQYLFK